MPLLLTNFRMLLIVNNDNAPDILPDVSFRDACLTFWRNAFWVYNVLSNDRLLILGYSCIVWCISQTVSFYLFLSTKRFWSHEWRGNSPHRRFFWQLIAANSYSTCVACQIVLLLVSRAYGGCSAAAPFRLLTFDGNGFHHQLLAQCCEAGRRWSIQFYYAFLINCCDYWYLGDYLVGSSASICIGLDGNLWQAHMSWQELSTIELGLVFNGMCLRLGYLEPSGLIDSH